jgi:extradiol dioxygenase family protein
MNEFKFHLSLPTSSIALTEKFYIDCLGFEKGRRGVNWVDINLFGNQITFTATGDFEFNAKKYAFEDKILPSFHFGILLDSKTWDKVFVLTKYEDFMWMNVSTFLEDKIGEHRSFFIEDPNGYIIEFKTFSKPEEVFSA